MLNLSRLKGFRFPHTVIGYAVWAYHRFALSLRDVEDLIASRGITVSRETSGTGWSVSAFNSPPSSAGRDQSRRNNAAARLFFRKFFKTSGQPREIVTDKLRSYGAAKTDLAPGIEHRQHKGLNNRAESSHRHAAANKRSWARSSRLVRRNGSCRSTIQPPPCFPPDVAVFLPDPIATPAPMPSSFGLNMHASCRPEPNAPLVLAVNRKQPDTAGGCTPRPFLSWI